LAAAFGTSEPGDDVDLIVAVGGAYTGDGHAGLVTRIADQHITAADEVHEAARDVLSTLPDTTVDAQRVIAAAAVLRRVADHWARLSPGEELILDWPEKPSRPRPR
jgi:hypothetical protein